MRNRWRALLSGTAASQETANTDADARAYGARLLAEAREELGRADAKAQLLLGVVGIGLGAVAAGLLAGSWSPFSLSNAVEWLWWVGIAAALGSVIVLAGAVYPQVVRTTDIETGTVMYFGDALRFTNTKDVAEALRRSSTLDLDRIADQIRRISVIVARKYRLVRTGCWLLCLSLLSTIFAILWNLFL
ncbi:Pycsar system effector family protein [Herbidospora mongoliensis]|uniref:Pycsar system effector family protein n=1 Tax=Herbidospora mongoliensis TaxID=688067 RepID=UPI0008306C8C|nr:Pycsar system effector family protein [Herbidospora mongoliensis]